ncbi:co-chaperone YbbN [Arcanobacterium haemolyticum]|uniref:Thioredoxin domain protein n=1 Tax=Arcanobacterium haemolyticum (strain ATCC 9345 / DSM 20595 / CCM 5947 / CCUG 17215 / LMG 16163 / NBRC 15585 / NCTC 8452 / 11018) TaxID=644284 RepID=D7BMI2_ARCHD|nr:tetratricopeptide repeat protein [Arcanobacterium haemolyticum]ADH92131.1 thioredoxin domain protein [Arcanobacterium haemolyticum DSM 20595]QCX46293.1 co-chaperone YbbN [Arcanobacterium haemolyticum]SQH29164.1 thioredoxin 2 [Arcanobacterium haemolyticum]
MNMPGFGGVYDLSTLKKEPETPQAPVDTGNTIPGPWVTEAAEANLQHVVQTSMSLPVLFVFMAPESEHSQTLVQNFTEVVNAHAGKIQLAVVDASVERGIAQAFGVNAVPTAIALLQGQPVPLFQGLPDMDSLTTTVTKLLDAAAQYGLTGVLDGDPDGTPPEPEIPPLHKEGLEALEAGNLEGAYAAYSAAIKENPGDSEAITALHQVELLQRVKAINPDGSPLEAQSILHAAASAPFTDVDAHLKAADLELSFGRADAAFARLLEVVKATSADDRDKARTRLLSLFDVVGQHSDLVSQTRKALTNALF